jgi:hypothetical protein
MIERDQHRCGDETETKRNLMKIANLLTEPRGPRPRPRAVLHAKTVTICWAILALGLSSLTLLQAQETNEVRKEENGKKRVFNFEGGSPVDFVVALDRHFRTRLIQVLTLPETLSRTKVPKLRVAAEDPREVLTLYNRLESPALGQWRFEPTQKTADTNMNVLMLVPDKTTATANPAQGVTRVKAIALAGVPESKWETLMRDIDQARAYGEEVSKGTGESFVGTVRVQRESKILIVAGSEAYLEMVGSLIEAHQMNASIEAKAKAAPEPAKTDSTR